MHTYLKILVVFIGGGAGSVMRYLLGKLINNFQFPLATFVSNLLASIVFGLFIGFVSTKFDTNSNIRLLILTGFCGGLSTFSTFNFEIFEMIKNGNYILAVGYVFVSIAACLLSYGLVLDIK